MNMIRVFSDEWHCENNKLSLQIHPTWWNHKPNQIQHSRWNCRTGSKWWWTRCCWWLWTRFWLFDLNRDELWWTGEEHPIGIKSDLFEEYPARFVYVILVFEADDCEQKWREEIMTKIMCTYRKWREADIENGEKQIENYVVNFVFVLSFWRMASLFENLVLWELVIWVLVAGFEKMVL